MEQGLRKVRGLISSCFAGHVGVFGESGQHLLTEDHNVQFKDNNGNPMTFEQVHDAAQSWNAQITLTGSFGETRISEIALKRVATPAPQKQAEVVPYPVLSI
ncbi:MAG TPA: hypothetical protein DCM27_01850 [Rhodospirillaceae bacterium]|nr:hypothetical protein [Rhodospirillaceae bacterium]